MAEFSRKNLTQILTPCTRQTNGFRVWLHFGNTQGNLSGSQLFFQRAQSARQNLPTEKSLSRKCASLPEKALLKNYSIFSTRKKKEEHSNHFHLGARTMLFFPRKRRSPAKRNSKKKVTSLPAGRIHGIPVQLSHWRWCSGQFECSSLPSTFHAQFFQPRSR